MPHPPGSEQPRAVISAPRLSTGTHLDPASPPKLGQLGHCWGNGLQVDLAVGGPGWSGSQCLLWWAEDSVCTSDRGSDSEVGENIPKIIRILFSLSSSLIHLDGEVLSGPPCLYFTFRGPFSARKDLGALHVALLSFPGMGHLKLSFNWAGSCPVWNYSSVNKGFVAVWKVVLFCDEGGVKCSGLMVTMKTSALSRWDGKCGCAAAFSAALRSTRTCLALGRCSVSWGWAVGGVWWGSCSCTVTAWAFWNWQGNSCVNPV